MKATQVIISVAAILALCGHDNRFAAAIYCSVYYILYFQENTSFQVIAKFTIAEGTRHQELSKPVGVLGIL